MQMTWLNTIDVQELYTLCPELRQIDIGTLKVPDDVVHLIRETKARYIWVNKLPRAMFPTPDIEEYRKLRTSYTNEGKSYERESVKKFDEIKNSYWEQIKKEIRLLICTKDKKYTELRKHLTETGKHSKAPVVGMISATLASSMGVAVGVISGL